MAEGFYISKDDWTQYQLQQLDDFSKTLILPSATPAPAPPPTPAPDAAPSPSATPFPSLDQVLTDAGVKDATASATPSAPPARDDWARQSTFPSFDQVLAGAGITPTMPSPAKLAGDSESAIQTETAAGQAFGGSPQDTPATNLSQFGDKQLSTEEAYAACGPAAAVRFAQRFGRNPTLREAVDLAKQVGWTPAQGMAGIESEQKLLQKVGIATRLERQVDWAKVAQDAENGNPVIVSTDGHYFSIGQDPSGKAFDETTGKFYVGSSGTDLRNGAAWMSPADMERAMGDVQGVLFADNPQTPVPSVAAQPAQPATTLRRNLPEQAQAFVDRLSPIAQKVSADTGIPAEVLLAIPANETGWGSSVAGNNLFGIKGRGPAGAVATPTWEVVNGQRQDITDTFRAYGDAEQSMRDFAAFLQQNPRYAGALQTLQQTGDPSAFVRAVGQAGYATDPQWADKVTRVMAQIGPVRGSPATASDGTASPPSSSAQAVSAPAQPAANPVQAFAQDLATTISSGLAKLLEGARGRDLAGAGLQPAGSFGGVAPTPEQVQAARDTLGTVTSTVDEHLPLSTAANIAVGNEAAIERWRQQFPAEDEQLRSLFAQRQSAGPLWETAPRYDQARQDFARLLGQREAFLSAVTGSHDIATTTDLGKQDLPELSAEGREGARRAGAILATVVAPGLEAGLARNAVGAVLDPSGQLQGAGLQAAAKGVGAVAGRAGRGLRGAVETSQDAARGAAAEGASHSGISSDTLYESSRSAPGTMTQVPASGPDSALASSTAPPSGIGRNLSNAPVSRSRYVPKSDEVAIRQPPSIGDLNTLLRQAEKEAPSFERGLRDAAAEVGGTFEGARVKESARVTEKIAEKVATGRPYDVRSLGDPLAGRIIVDEPSMIPAAREAVARRLGATEIAFDNRFPNGNVEPTPFGYRDAASLMRLPSGMVVEVSYTLPEMAQVSHGDARSLYKFWRARLANPRPWSAEETAKLQADLQRSRALYDAALAEAEQRLRGTTSGGVWPDLTTKPGPSGAGPAPSQALVGPSAAGGRVLNPAVLRGAIQGGIAGAAQEQQQTGQVTPQGVLTGAALGSLSRAAVEHAPVVGRPARVLSGRVLRAVEEASAEEAAAGQAAPVEPHGLTIDLSKYPEEVRQLIQQGYERASTTMDTARRGVMVDQAVRDLADQTQSKVGLIAANWKPGQAKNAETILALREALAAQGERVLQAQKTLRVAPQSADALNAMAEELAKHASVQEVVTGVTAEAGRALRQFRQPVTGQAYALQQLQKIAKATGMTPDELATHLAEVDLSDPVKVANLARTLTQHTFGDKLQALWYFNLLSSPLTHIKNTVSNALVVASRPVEAAVSASIDAARVGGLHVLGRQAQRERYVGEVPELVFGMKAGLQDGLSGALQILRRGFSDAEVTGKLENLTREPFKGQVSAALTEKNPVGVAQAVGANIVNAPGRSLRASDVFFRTLNRTADLYAQSYRMAKQEGLKGQAFADRIAELRANPTPEMLAHADKQAAYRVFQQDGQFVQAVGSFRDKVPALRFVVPFVQTPYNIAKYALEYSPLGAVGIGIDKATGRLGAKGAGDLSDRLARVAMGSAVMYGMYQFAEQGNLTGPVPKDPALRDAFYRQGKQPYSFRGPDGAWHSYAALQPFSTIFAGAAIASDLRQQGKDQDALTLGLAMSLGVSRALLDQPWTDGLTNFIDFVSGNSPENVGDVLQAAKKYGEQVAPSAAVPAFMRFLARAGDSIIRDPDGPLEAIAAVTPGLSGTVPARLNAFGEASPRASTGLAALNPFTSSPSTADPVEIELARLQKAGYDVEPGLVGKKVTAFKTPVQLTRDQQREYQMVSGTLAKVLLATVVDSDAWRALPDAQKADAVDKITRRVRTYAREQLQPHLLDQAVESRLTILKRGLDRAATP